MANMPPCTYRVARSVDCELGLQVLWAVLVTPRSCSRTDAPKMVAPETEERAWVFVVVAGVLARLLGFAGMG